MDATQQGTTTDNSDLALARLSAANQWIPVSERLPETGVAVIGWFPGASYSFECSHDGGGWCDHGTGLHLYDNERPTHWMPFPQGPLCRHVAGAAGANDMRIDPDTCTDPVLLSAEVKRLRRIIDAAHPYPTDSPPETDESGGDSGSSAGKSDQTAIPPAWHQRPYYVDPPSGHRYGFPQLYDPQADGDMTEWMIRNGYPERLARQGLPCTFTACTEDGEK
jgi:subtilisin family serine protease